MDILLDDRVEEPRLPTSFTDAANEIHEFTSSSLAYFDRNGGVFNRGFSTLHAYAMRGI